MKTTTITLMLALVPAVLCAQVSAQAGGSAQGGVGAPQKNGTTSASASGGASADANANAEYKAPPEYSAEGKAKLEAMYADARSKRVPVGAIARRVAEGRA